MIYNEMDRTHIALYVKDVEVTRRPYINDPDGYTVEIHTWDGVGE